MTTLEIANSPYFTTVLMRTGFFAVIVLFAGCTTVTRPMGVTSPPPPPPGGLAPIAAYDDYAWAVVVQHEARGKVLAVIVPSSSQSSLVVLAPLKTQGFAASGGN